MSNTQINPNTIIRRATELATEQLQRWNLAAQEADADADARGTVSIEAIAQAVAHLALGKMFIPPGVIDPQDEQDRDLQAHMFLMMQEIQNELRRVIPEGPPSDS